MTLPRRPILRHRPGRWLAAGSLLLAGLGLSACGGGSELPQAMTVDFAADASAWRLGTSDYSADTAPSDAQARLVTLSAPLSGGGLRLSATNHSDDLFTYVWRPIDGLSPGTRYRAHWALQVVAELPAGCFGVGGAPAEAVTIKAGVAGRQPDTVLTGGEYLFNLDKGDQTQGGSESVVLGDLSSSGVDCVSVPLEFKTMSGTQSALVEADAQGRAWLWVGMDSGYEAASGLTLVAADIVLTPQ